MKKTGGFLVRYALENIKVKYDMSKPSITTKVCLNVDKAKAILGWSPKISLDEGIRKTMEWYGCNININRIISV